ncbi:MAG: YhbY family RNA-binding protein [Oscillospiraceae bacterium]|jgi:RNA-binding protein|nr:YhbY family RNA-binding protein [Oscillospiraceae bacterium]
MITSKQRAALRALANKMDTILQVGKSGIIETTVVQVDDALTARELIKLRVLETCPLSAKEAAQELAEKTKADIVQVIGMRFVLWRRNLKEPKIEI